MPLQHHRREMQSKGWANPRHECGPEFPQTWHVYTGETNNDKSLCGRWSYEVGTDHALNAEPHGKVCKICQRLTTKEPANATP